VFRHIPGSDNGLADYFSRVIDSLSAARVSSISASGLLGALPMDLIDGGASNGNRAAPPDGGDVDVVTPASLVFNAVTLGVPLSVSFIAGPIAGAVFYLLWNVGTLANSFVAALTSLGLGEHRRHSRREIVKNIGFVGLVAGVGGEVALLTFGDAYFRAGWLASLVLGLALVPYGYLQFRVMFLRRAGNHLRASVGTLALLLVAELPLLLLRPQELVMAALIWLAATMVASLSVS
jgi:hypothetical protein